MIHLIGNGIVTIGCQHFIAANCMAIGTIDDDAIGFIYLQLQMEEKRKRDKLIFRDLLNQMMILLDVLVHSMQEAINLFQIRTTN